MEQHEIKNRIKQVLEQGYLMSLATQDTSGLWVADVIYIFDDEFNLYWMSDPDVRHSQALLQNSPVAFSITASEPRQNNFGVQGSGRAERINGARFDLALKHLQKRGKPMPAETDDVLQGDSWYMVRPEKIDLIDEESSGFVKQHFTL